MPKNKYIQTPEFRLVFPALFTPRAYEGSSKEKYSCIMLFAKGTDLSALKEACKEAYEAEFPQGAKGARSPLCDGNEKVDEWGEAFRDAIYVRASSIMKPGVCDRRKALITEPDVVYSGQYARAMVHAYAYNTMGNKGVSIGLDAVQIVRDGEPLGGGAAMVNSFDDLGEGESGSDAPKTASTAGGLFD